MKNVGKMRILVRSAAISMSVAAISAASAQDLTITDEECAAIMTQIGNGIAPNTSPNETTGQNGAPAATGASSQAPAGTPGPNDPPGAVVQPLPPGAPTNSNSPTPATIPGTNAGGGGGSRTGGGTVGGASAGNSTSNINANEGKYLLRPNINDARTSFGRSQSSDNKNNTIIFYRGTANPAFQQNVARDKPYRPGRAGPIRTVRGQPIAVKNSTVRVANLSQGIVNAFDEIHLIAKAKGFPAPLVTSGNDSEHSRGSKHFSNDAIDIRCNSANGMTKSKCISYVQSMKAALGPRYDVIYEDYGNSNSHIHISFLG